MNLQEATNLINQVKAEGFDVAALSQAAGGKTSLGLNRWVATDKPTMAEFNEDNRIVDEKLRELSEKKVNVGDLRVLWSGSANTIGTMMNLTEPISNFRYLIVFTGATPNSRYDFLARYNKFDDTSTLNTIVFASDGRVGYVQATGRGPSQLELTIANPFLSSATAGIRSIVGVVL